MPIAMRFCSCDQSRILVSLNLRDKQNITRRNAMWPSLSQQFSTACLWCIRTFRPQRYPLRMPTRSRRKGTARFRLYAYTQDVPLPGTAAQSGCCILPGSLSQDFRISTWLPLILVLPSPFYCPVVPSGPSGAGPISSRISITRPVPLQSSQSTFTRPLLKWPLPQQTSHAFSIFTPLSF